MKKVTFLLLGTLMIAGGLLVSCQKKGGHSHPHKTPPTHPCHPDNPGEPCRKY